MGAAGLYRMIGGDLQIRRRRSRCHSVELNPRCWLVCASAGRAAAEIHSDR